MITIYTYQDHMAKQQQVLTAYEEQVERTLLDTITKLLKEGDVTVERSQEIAENFLALLPFQSKTDLLKKLQGFVAEYPELQSVYAQYAQPYEDETKTTKLNQIRTQIKHGNIDKAVQIAKGGV